MQIVRLYVDTPLADGAGHGCTRGQANYLLNVMRLRPGDEVLLFDGANGEWRASIEEAGKGRCILRALAQVRAQEAGPDLHYLFAPLKRARLDYMVQKATEMGVAALRPVLTRRTQAERVRLERMRANAVEAAEQCGVLRIPQVHEPETLADVLAAWDPARCLVYCDEAAARASPLAALRARAPGPLALLIGPEGGFDSDEREQLRAQAFVLPISLGPRVMRADTAAVAALALINATLGDWR